MVVKRNIIKAVKFISDKYPIIALTGPRQSGKTTILKTVFEKYQYVSMENPDTRNFFARDPQGFFRQYKQHIIFDEAQRTPELFSYLQTIVDDSRMMGQFILSGSQNFHLMQSITQSLAGRVAILRLFPFDHQEMRAAKLLPNDYLQLLVRGFYPAVYDRDIPSKTFYANYIQTYIQRDVSELIAVRDMRMFQNFLSLCATRAGQLLNLNSLANECGISQPTAKAWLSALENSYILFQLHPYFRNFSKRIVKTPKLYFYDTGLLCHLLKITNSEQLVMHPAKGSLFENMMIAEYVKRMNHKNDLSDIWFWRDSHGKEVDFMVENDKGFFLTEIKATQTIFMEMFDLLNYFEEISAIPNITKQVVYGGNTTEKRTPGKVIAWHEFGK